MDESASSSEDEAVVAERRRAKRMRKDKRRQEREQRVQEKQERRERKRTRHTCRERELKVESPVVPADENAASVCFRDDISGRPIATQTENDGGPSSASSGASATASSAMGGAAGGLSIGELRRRRLIHLGLVSSHNGNDRVVPDVDDTQQACTKRRDNDLHHGNTVLTAAAAASTSVVSRTNALAATATARTLEQEAQLRAACIKSMWQRCTKRGF